MLTVKIYICNALKSSLDKSPNAKQNLEEIQTRIYNFKLKDQEVVKMEVEEAKRSGLKLMEESKAAILTTIDRRWFSNNESNV